MLFLGLRDFERGGAVIESGWNGAEEDLGSGRLRGFPLCGLSNLLFRHAVKGLCHGGIEPYGSVGEPLEQDFKAFVLLYLRVSTSGNISANRYHPLSHSPSYWSS